MDSNELNPQARRSNGAFTGEPENGVSGAAPASGSAGPQLRVHSRSPGRPGNGAPGGTVPGTSRSRRSIFPRGAERIAAQTSARPQRTSGDGAQIRSEDILAVYIDQISLRGGSRLLCAMGVAGAGERRLLGYRAGGIESPEAVDALLSQLARFGIAGGDPKLFVIPDSDELSSALKLAFGSGHFIQRCRKDKERNVLKALPPHAKQEIRGYIHGALLLPAEQGAASLKQLAYQMTRSHPEAARRLASGIEDCFTVSDLEVGPTLLRSLDTTGPLRAVGAQLRHLQAAWRLAGSSDDSAPMEPAFARAVVETLRRLPGFKDLPKLREVLSKSSASPADRQSGPQRYSGPSAPDGHAFEARPFYPLHEMRTESSASVAPRPFPNGNPSESASSLLAPTPRRQPVRRQERRISRMFGWARSLRKRWGAPRPAPRWKLDLAQREELRLVQRLFLLPGRHAPKVVVFSGVESRAGCSRVCARAAVTLAAQEVGTVCVVDANLQSPSLHQYFGIENARGLTEVILDSQPIRNCVQRLSAENLWVMPAGLPPADPSAGVTPDRLKAFVAEVSKAFDFVLIDVPPFQPYDYSAQLARLSDGVVAVIEANSTHRESARRIKDALASSNMRVLGAVLNKRTFPIPNWLYRSLFAT